MDELTRKVADAWCNEWERWGTRNNKAKGVFEICRDDDSEEAWEMSEIIEVPVSFSYQTLEEKFDEVCREHAAQAVIHLLISEGRLVL